METTNNLGALLPIKENNGKRAVNARDLYLFLGYDKSQWARWYTTNIINNDFAEEGIDYQTFDTMSNGNATKEFALSIDFAKELSMLARNERGKQARKYFIACEDKLKEAVTKGYVTTSTANPQQQLTMKDKMQAASWAAKFLNLNDASKLLMAQQILAPTGLILPEYTNSKGFLLSADKLLKSNGVNMNSHKFNLMLQEKGYVTYRERPSKSKGTKRFPVLTAKGLKYGENQVHPKNQAETQIRYYEDKFPELLKELGLK